MGVLIFSAADELDSLDACPYGIYHRFDISFLFYNLRQDAANRANKFLETVWILFLSSFLRN